MPFTYVFLDIVSTDGLAHDIRIYADVAPCKSYPLFFFLSLSNLRALSLAWLHGSDLSQAHSDPKVNVNGSLISSTDFLGLQMQLQSTQPFTEIADHAQDVIGVFAMKSVS